MTPGPEKSEKFYGRRMGQTLSARKKRLLAEVLPKFSIAREALDEGPVSPASLFDFAPPDTWLEIGFGKGEHLAWQAERHPGLGFIGCEPFINGVAGLVTKIHEKGLTNIRIFPDDARVLIDRLKPASIGRVFLFHPDPWPKARHARRRFINPDNLDRLARILKPGGELRVSTDHDVYKAWTMFIMQNRPDFAWTAASAGDWRNPPGDWPGTRYEAKALKEAARPAYFTFLRTGNVTKAD